MNEKAPSLEQWQRLYEMAAEIKKMTPWEWIDETNLIGIQDPLSGDVNYLSVMGSLGEHLALSIYLGIDGLIGLDQFTANPDDLNHEIFLETPQIQISFEDRGFLENEDRQLIKELGLKFRGKQSWPLFRSYRPGSVPWFLNAEEAQTMQTALDQFIEVAQRYQKDQSYLDKEDDRLYLIRKPVLDQGQLIWQDHYENLSVPLKVHTPRVKLPAKLVKQLKKADRVTNILEVDLFMLHAEVGNEAGRPYFPYILLIVAPEGYVIGEKILAPLPDLDSMRTEAAIFLFETLAKEGVILKGIMVQTDMMFDLLAPLCDDWKIGLKKVARLKAMADVRQSLEQFMQ